MTATGSRFLQRRQQNATNRLEQILIMATIAILPMEVAAAQITGTSVVWLLFAAQAGYLISKRPDCLAKTWLHPLLLAVYVFLGLAYFMEFSHPNSDYDEIFRMVQNVCGSVFLASLCRDRRALRVAMYGFLIVGAYTSIALLRNYGTLSSAVAVDYGEGDRLRAEVFTENPLQQNLNTIAFSAAQGAGVALALALTARSKRSRYLFSALALASFVGSFMPMSRSGVLILGGVGAVVMFAYGMARIKTLMLVILIGVVVLTLIPSSVLSRLSFSTEVTQSGRMEGRAEIYTAFFKHLPEFILTGVGAGNFRGEWGRNSMYSDSKGRISGAHNVFFQMTIYWGLLALFLLIVIVWQCYRCLPGRYGNDGLAIGLLCVTVSLLLLSLSVHTLYDKAFAIGIGLLVGAHNWIWPKPTVPTVPRRRRVVELAPGHS